MAARLQRLRRESLSEPFTVAGPQFRRAAPWLLAAVLFIALIVRIHPAIRFAIWGSDSGEYLFLTQQLVDTGRVLFEYDGWGIAYPYFPGMFVLSGAATAVLGIDVTRAVLWITPMVSAALPVMVALLAYRITSDPRVGVLAGAIAAVSALIVITTSHAMPGTLGQVLILGILMFLPAAYRDRRHLLLFAIFGAALLFTHHLSTYFAIGILAFIPFYRELSQQNTDHWKLRVEVPLVGGLLVGAAVWWLGVAVPFREQIVGDTLDVNPWVTAALFIVALASLPLLVVARRRYVAWHHAPRYPSFVRQWVYVGAAFVGFFLVLLFAIFVRVPGTDIRIAPSALIYATPVLATLAFLPAGHATARFHRRGSIILGWMYAILASLAFASITNSRVLFPFRHVDYMMAAMATLCAMGMVMAYDQTVASRVPNDRARARFQLVSFAIALILLGAVFSLPPREVIGGFEEGLSAEELLAVEWVRDHPEIIPVGSTMAADHRVSSLLWGIAGIHATWDYTPRTYHSENASAVLNELSDAQIPAEGRGRVDYVFLSPPIEQGVTMLQWEQSSPMSAAAIAKFDDATVFERVYDQNGVRIYRVLWPDVQPEGSAT